MRPHETGSAAGLLNAVRQLGGTLGVALLGSVLLAAPDALTGARNACWIGAGLVFATGVTAGLMTGCPPRPATALLEGP
ncbi:hypothetical protein [Actinomadura sp. DC4]|uniref:hypothetical protein n=1 Tax=Actinomadura sp. DC4 TaxID=3055069 RepID=UPI0025AED9C1|nr:hypothetical protein [Actinomadura sp. DC4]MDN3358743.1 hypothetical protein [Actinomadura sp. DC4]